MIELLNSITEQTKPPEGDALFLYDPATNKDLISNIVVGALKAGTVVDSTYLIDNQPTLRVDNANAGAVLTFPSSIDLNALTEWTLEWSSRPTSIGGYYFTELFLDVAGGSGYPVGCRWTDTGYGNTLQFNAADWANERIWRPPFTKSTAVNTLNRYALVFKGGNFTVFRNGTKQMLTNATGGVGSTTQDYFPKTQAWGLFKILTLGYLNSVNSSWIGNYGRIRISNFARYLGSYTPEAF